jgi:hypothetical protein
MVRFASEPTFQLDRIQCPNFTHLSAHPQQSDAILLGSAGNCWLKDYRGMSVVSHEVNSNGPANMVNGPGDLVRTGDLVKAGDVARSGDVVRASDKPQSCKLRAVACERRRWNVLGLPNYQ